MASTARSCFGNLFARNRSAERVLASEMMVPAKGRYFEDYAAGAVYEFGPIALSEHDV